MNTSTLKQIIKKQNPHQEQLTQTLFSHWKFASYEDNSPKGRNEWRSQYDGNRDAVKMIFIVKLSWTTACSWFNIYRDNYIILMFKWFRNDFKFEPWVHRQMSMSCRSTMFWCNPPLKNAWLIVTVTCLILKFKFKI